jgi:uncharacterized protein
MGSPEHSSKPKIRISGLSNGIHEYRFCTEAKELGLEPNFTHPVNVTAVLDKAQHQIYLKTEIATSARFSCDRCVEEFERPLAARINMLYVYDGDKTVERDTDEVHVIAPDTVIIDLTEDVRQMVELSVPLKLLCKEECKGLCPRCGTNLNRGSCACKDDAVDPRWEGLANLLND